MSWLSILCICVFLFNNVACLDTKSLRQSKLTKYQAAVIDETCTPDITFQLKCHLFPATKDNFLCRIPYLLPSLGIFLPQLDNNCKPTLNTSFIGNSLQCINEAESINQWFNNDGNGFPIHMNAPGGPLNNTYLYPSTPIEKIVKPFFTCSAHLCFVHRPLKTFFVNTNNELWLFVNNVLVLDMGGIHGTINGSINFDTLGLQENQTYKIDLFIAQRRTTHAIMTTQSNLCLFACDNCSSSVVTEPICPYCSSSQGGYGGKCNLKTLPCCEKMVANWTSYSHSCIRDACVGDRPFTLGNTSHGFSVNFTSASAISLFLPAGSTSSTFNSNGVNPTTTSAGVFAGQLLTAMMSVRFNENNTANISLLSFKNCTEIDERIDGLSLIYVIYCANQVISGQADTECANYTPSMLNDALALFNTHFESCTSNSSCFTCQDRVIMSPTGSPTGTPTYNPTPSPTQLTLTPTLTPTPGPTSNPSMNPTVSPVETPSSNPTLSPSAEPTNSPVDSTGPTMNPTAEPTNSPSSNPTLEPSYNPTPSPTGEPTDSINPTQSPTMEPSYNPSANPTIAPSSSPTLEPSYNPTLSPSINPTHEPTIAPSVGPTAAPVETPTLSPSKEPTNSPTEPSSGPTPSPTIPTTCCGNGIIEFPEECDDGLLNNNTHGLCMENCKRPVCGDGVIHLCNNDCDSDDCESTCISEECDDGNLFNDDGCSSLCRYENINC